MSEGANRIWKPLVKPNDVSLPSPGSLSPNKSQQVYTKTSLIAQQDSLERRLNREILTATQSYNNAPKPFTKQPTLEKTTTTTTTVSSLDFEAQDRIDSKQSDRQQQQLVLDQQQQQQQQSVEGTETRIGCSQQTNREQQEENMAPKLVHNLYNSPLNLYSMDNIRKTIEAHTEYIAPGLKGINFMKGDAPVNKQSEVYKLVMEEEEQRSRQVGGSSARLSPISGHPVNIGAFGAPVSTSLTADQQQSQAAGHHQAGSGRLSPHPMPGGSSSSTSGSNISINSELRNQESKERFVSTTSGLPVCCECGQSIVGPFARIKPNRSVHPQCFNCATCGTSLKNTGYFIVNEKFYCDIHAKQVANMMRLQYDFENKQQQSNLYQQQRGQSSDRSEQKQVPGQPQQHQQQQFATQPPPPPLANLCNQGSTIGSSSQNPATISTMFADRSKSVTNNGVKWSWRPVTSKDRLSSTAASSSSTIQSTSSYTQQMVRGSSHSPTGLQVSGSSGSGGGGCNMQNSQQSTVSHNSRSQSLLQQQGSTLIGDRVPICINCHVQIQGPYILAGTRIWCKLCSQTYFNCSSCHRSLLNSGFIEDTSDKFYCEHCFEAYHAPICAKCNIRIKGDCLNALGKQWHPSCFVCGHCQRPFGNSSFYLEDNVPYCERDWSLLFTTKCYTCGYPIEAGDKWIEALDRNYHSNCFRCTSCQTNLEGGTFYCKGGKPYCRLHAR